MAREVASRFGVGSGVGVGAGDPTVFAVKKSIARPSSRSAKIQPPSAIMSRWPPELVRRRLTRLCPRLPRLGAPARPEPLRIQAAGRGGLLDVDPRAATETLDDPFQPFDQCPHVSRDLVLALRGAHGDRRDITRHLR